MWSTCFIFWSPLLPHYDMLIQIFMNSWQIPLIYAVCSIPPSDGILLPSYHPPFSFAFFFAIHLWYLSLTLTLSVGCWTVTKLVFSCHLKFSFCGVKLVFTLYSAVILRGWTRATQVPSGGENTYGRTQNLYVLRDLACHSCSQYDTISKECLIHSCCKKSWVLEPKRQDVWTNYVVVALAVQ